MDQFSQPMNPMNPMSGMMSGMATPPSLSNSFGLNLPSPAGDGGMNEGDDTKSGLIKREAPDLSQSRERLVKDIIARVQLGKKARKKDFQKMREEMAFARGEQWDGEAESKEKYVANIVQRHIQQRVSSLYAKNPKAVCRRRQTMDFAVWDENADTLQQAYTQMQMANMGGNTPLMPQVQSVVQDAMQGFQKRAMLDKVSKTMEILFHYYLHNQEPNFKLQMKQLVRRVCTTSVGFVKLGFQRIMEKRPEDVDKITDMTQQIAQLERLLADKLDDKIDEGSSQLEELRLALGELQDRPQMVVKEGLVFDFPSSTSIIVDPKCRNIRTFIGAQWIAQEFILSPDDVKEIYKVDIGTGYTAYKEDAPYVGGVSSPDRYSKDDPKGDAKTQCVVWEVYSKTDNMLYVVCDGYPDFLQEPSVPPLLLERFWPIFSLTFNDVENETRIYPPSDVELLMPMQREYNRSRQAMREHRIANRPAYAVPQGMLDEEDIQKLKDRPNNAVIALNALQQGQKVDDVIQPIKSHGIDPALYDNNAIFDDILKTVGDQEANIGGSNSATATQSSIAESSRSAAIASNVDDLDDFLTEICKAAGQAMLLNVTQETVTKIVGPGSVWPQISAQDMADELILEVEAGSSGRPNKAADSSNFQQIAPILMQIPGINPTWMAKQAIKRLDDSLDLTDAIAAGIQSIMAMNAQKQLSTAVDQTQNPNAQGAHGAGNSPAAPGQASAPAPSPTVGGPGHQMANSVGGDASRAPGM